VPDRTEKVYLGLGANAGDPVEQLRKAVAELRARRIILEPIALSSLYRTPPWGGIGDQPWFVNAALSGATALSPQELLAALKQIEGDLGRKPAPRRWGPRPIDLDILLFGQRIVRTPNLTIPHPHITERAFALLPLVEIEPLLADPATGRRYADCLAALGDEIARIEKMKDEL